MSDIKTKTPTKNELIAALAAFSLKLTFALMDGKVSDEEFMELGIEFANAGMNLYGIPFKFKKVIPDIQSIPNIEY